MAVARVVVRQRGSFGEEQGQKADESILRPLHGVAVPPEGDCVASYDVRMDESFLRIGQLASRAGVSPDSSRHYERLGLLQTPNRTNGGYRVFSPAAVERVQLIRSAVRVGFSLRQLDRSGAATNAVARDLAEPPVVVIFP